MKPKLKLDENLGRSAKQRLGAAGFDVLSVADQGMAGTTDAALVEQCGAEGRSLITLDLDFSNPLRFPPSKYAGIAVLRLPEPVTPAALSGAVDSLVEGLKIRRLDRKLWVVREGSIREYTEDNTDE